MAVKGVDISEFNGDVDFGALKKAGIEFVLIRTGFGGDYAKQDDSMFEANVKKADAIGMPWGVYHYSYAKSASMAQSEANHVLRLLNGRRPLYGVWYDVEDAQISGYNLVLHCQTFCNAIEKAGLYCGIYSMLSWLENKLDDPLLDKYDKWVAQWNKECQYTKPYGIWQFTDELIIGGNRFDGNWAYKDYPAITGKGEDDVTKEEVIELARAAAQEVYKENANKYPTFESLPNWARDAAVKVYEELGLTGTGGDDKTINADYTYARVMVVIAALLKKMEET